MAATLPIHGLTYAEYLELERTTNERHQYLGGEVWLMAGGTPRHAGIITNVTVAVSLGLRGKPCRSYGTDMKIRVATTGLATYPDLSVVCGGLETHPEDPNAVINPTALFEVLSPSTEGWDRGGKFMHAQQIPSLRHYVLVSQDQIAVEVFTRAEGGWLYTRYGTGDRVTLSALAVTLAVDELYADLPPVPDEASDATPPRAR